MRSTRTTVYVIVSYGRSILPECSSSSEMWYILFSLLT